MDKAAQKALFSEIRKLFKEIQADEETQKALKAEVVNLFKEVRGGFSHLYQDRNTDRDLLEKLYGQDGVGGLKNEMQLFRQSMDELTKAIKGINREIQEQGKQIESSSEEIAEAVVENLENLQDEVKKAGAGKKTKFLDRILRRQKKS